MEHVEVSETLQSPPSIGETISKKTDADGERIMHGAVDIVDHYAIKCDPKSNECSDSSHPLRPPRKYSDYSSESMPSSRKSSEHLDTSPIKPSRKLSQTSTNRKFSTTSETSSIRTPKKVSFSDELPLVSMQLTGILGENESQANSDYLSTLSHAIMNATALDSIEHSNDEEEEDDDDDDDRENDSDSYSLPSSSISTQTMNELTKADMFPNSRKVSMHSERSFDMSTGSSQKPGTESATTQITTESSGKPMDAFLENERKMSTGSIKSNYIISAESISG